MKHRLLRSISHKILSLKIKKIHIRIERTRFDVKIVQFA